MPKSFVFPPLSYSACASCRYPLNRSLFVALVIVVVVAVLLTWFLCLVVTFAYAAAKVIAFAQPSTSTSTALPARDTPHCTSAPPQAAVEMPQNVQLSVYAATLRPSTSLPLSLPHSLSPSVDLPALSAIWDSVEVFGLGGVGYVGFHLENTSKMPVASPPTSPLAAARTLRHFCNRNPNHTQIAITSICFDCPPSGGWRRRFVFNCFH